MSSRSKWIYIHWRRWIVNTHYYIHIRSSRYKSSISLALYFFFIFIVVSVHACIQTKKSKFLCYSLAKISAEMKFMTFSQVYIANERPRGICVCVCAKVCGALRARPGMRDSLKSAVELHTHTHKHQVYSTTDISLAVYIQDAYRYFLRLDQCCLSFAARRGKERRKKNSNIVTWLLTNATFPRDGFCCFCRANWCDSALSRETYGRIGTRVNERIIISGRKGL